MVIYADPARGTFRYASIVGGRLEACLFLARQKSSLPSHDAVAALLGTRIESEMRTRMLAGGTVSAGASHAAGRTICACFAVGLDTLHRTIASRRLTTLAEIGAALRAGTNCGSCIPGLKAILNEASLDNIASA